MNKTRVVLSSQIAGAGYRRVDSDHGATIVYERRLPALPDLVSQLVIYEEQDHQFQPILFLVSYGVAEFCVRHEIFEGRRVVHPIAPACLIGREFVSSSASDESRRGPLWPRWDVGFLSMLDEYERDFAELFDDDSHIGKLICDRSGASVVHQREGLVNYAIACYMNGSSSLGNRLLKSFLDLATIDRIWYGFDSIAEIERLVVRIAARFEAKS